MNLFRTTIVGLFFLLSMLSFGQNPKRIVSLAPSLTKNIYFLEAQNQLIGCTSYCTEAVAEKKDIVASAVTVNLEKVISLIPDLVIVTTITSPETIDKLKNFGIKVEVFPTPKSFEEICSQFERLGKITGNSDVAQKVISESKSKIEKLKLRKGETTKVFFQIGADPIFTVLPNTFMNDYITIPGGENIAQDLTKGTMTRESVLARNPDYIFIVTMGIIGENEQQTWLEFPELEASKKKHIFIVDAEQACSPTPITFIQTLETIVNYMNNQ